MLLQVFVDILVRYFLSKLYDHLSPYEFEYLINSEWPFSSLLPLMEDNFVDEFSVFHHLDISCKSVAQENPRYREEPGVD